MNKTLLITLLLIAPQSVFGMKENKTVDINDAYHQAQMISYRKALETIKTNDIDALRTLLTSNLLDLKFKQVPACSTSSFYLLEAAIENANIPACKALLAHGANINEHASYWQPVTLLSIAISCCTGLHNDHFLDVCRLLLRHGAHITEHCITLTDKPYSWPIAQIIATHILSYPNPQEPPLFTLHLNGQDIPILRSNIDNLRVILGKQRFRDHSNYSPSAYAGLRPILRREADNSFALQNAIIEIFSAQGQANF